MDRVTPILPNLDLIADLQKEIIPDYVIASFNELIAKHFRYDDREANVTAEEVVLTIIDKSDGTITRKELYDRKFLDIETIFSSVGWKVVYNKPYYDESYAPFYTFSFKKKG